MGVRRMSPAERVEQLTEWIAVTRKHLRLRKQNLREAIQLGIYDNAYIGHLRKLCAESAEDERSLERALFAARLKSGIAQ